VRWAHLQAYLRSLPLSGAALAADRPYTEGPVSVVTGIRTEPGLGLVEVSGRGSRCRQARHHAWLHFQDTAGDEHELLLALPGTLMRTVPG
jgi:hypothetical protein